MANRWVVAVTILNAALFVCSIGFVWTSAQTEYSVAKPWVLEFTPSQPVIKLERFSLEDGYDVTTDTYKMIKISLTNYGAGAFGAGVAVVMFDKDFSKICEGTVSTPQMAPEGTFEMEVPLVWVPGAKVIDVTFVRVGVQEFRVS